MEPLLPMALVGPLLPMTLVELLLPMALVGLLPRSLSNSGPRRLFSSTRVDERPLLLIRALGSYCADKSASVE